MFKTSNEDVLHWKSSKSQAIGSNTPIHKKLIILTSIVLLSMFTITSSINSKAEQDIVWNQEMVSNPEAFLNVVFKDNIHLDNIIDNELTSVKNNQGYELDQSKFIINSLSGLSNIGGTQQRISIQGNYSTRTLEKEYKNKLSEVITKVDDLKNNGSHIDNLSSDDQTKLNHQLSKMNGVELKAQRYWNWGDDKILSLSIIGNTANLYDIKEILEDSGHTKQVDVIEMATITKQIEEINKAVEGMTEEGKQNYVQKLYAETIKLQLTKQGITGNIDEYMKLQIENAPEYQKEVIEDVLKEKEIISFETSVSNFSKQLAVGTSSKAGGCVENMNVKYNYWLPYEIELNKCAVNTLVFGGAVVALLLAGLGFASICFAICGVLSAIIGYNAALLQYVDNRCGDYGGARIYLKGTYYWISQRC